MTIRWTGAAVLSACAGFLLALSACGGGGGGGGGGGLPPFGLGGAAPGANPPSPVTVSGKVMVQGPVSGALVCVDRNRSGTCDDGEPAAAKTGDDGAYSIGYTPADEAAAAELAAAPLLAQVDGSNPSLPAFSKAFTMSAPAGHRAQVNPLTSLLQAGVAAGLAPERAEALVLQQLRLPEAAQLYDYQGVAVTDPARFEDNAFTAALITADALHSGVALRVVDTATVTPVASDQLARLDFTSADAYTARTYPTDGVPDATGKLKLTDRREGKTAGAPTAHDTLYGVYLQLGPNGWVRCDENAAFTSTLGTPSRSDYCGGTTRSLGHTAVTDISGRKMAEVVAEIQAADGNSIFGVVPSAAFANPDATFPAGSQLRYRRGVDLAQPYSINLAIPAEKTGFATLEALMTAFPTSGASLPAGTGTTSLGVLDEQQTRILRVAFTGAGAVQYYACNFYLATSTYDTCAATEAGTVEIRTEGGARVLVFNGGHPPTGVWPLLRTYGEYGGAVYVVRGTKSDARYNVNTARRLNGVAWEAMKPQLGIGSAV
ncbi:hypothetical protein [Variovorax sp. Root411]|uniref:hypothetical protein n=1 Tax=Variovorax sp. Root411 TaxID=1736530 RepID=UPI0006F492DB|nr:hypothetical protein [Variovorax sp. Root411]KQW59745.1 hypothetical protein ASC92_09105 [Variovorax sp. Root411]